MPITNKVSAYDGGGASGSQKYLSQVMPWTAPSLNTNNTGVTPVAGKTVPRQEDLTPRDPKRPGGIDLRKGLVQLADTAQDVAANNYNNYNSSQPVTSSLASTPYYSGHDAQTPDYMQMINDLYDKNLAAQRAQLDADYEAVMRQIDAAAGRIPQQYQAAGNDLNAQYERQRMAMNEHLAANGLNSGAGSQAALAQNAGYQGAYGQLMQAQANAQADLERQRVEQEAAYQSAITQALKTNDYQRAVALMQEMKDQRSADLDKAKILAGYGDFSGYAQLYGDDAANNMRQLWMAQNPQFAYMTGSMSADDYYKLTGQYAPGTAPQTYYVPDNSNDKEEEKNKRPGGTYNGVGTTWNTVQNGNKQNGVDYATYRGLMQAIAGTTNAQEASAVFSKLPQSALSQLSADQKRSLQAALYQRGVR